jgi:hypothetical protein
VGDDTRDLIDLEGNFEPEGLKCTARELDGVVGVRGQMWVLSNRWSAIAAEGDDETKGV